VSPAKILYQRLKANGLDFFTSVPCMLLGDLISLLERDREVTYTPVTREEEGIGILAGACLGGRRPAIIMQNSGLGNSINALCSLVGLYRLPIVMILSHRGSEGERIDAQMPMGRATEKLLRSIEVPFRVIRNTGEIDLADRVIAEGFKKKRPVALLFPHSYWIKEKADDQV